MAGKTKNTSYVAINLAPTELFEYDIRYVVIIFSEIKLI